MTEAERRLRIGFGYGSPGEQIDGLFAASLPVGDNPRQMQDVRSFGIGAKHSFAKHARPFEVT